uniref:Uncharacterized protein n=1 Tax=Podoviridae sp. ctzMH52 TaxID=2826596 RepID=A0A8S5N3U6_9CAUD|nr:MAG TPA: hypothetical protein [Podoviridae sp. ctzMH52]
MTRWSGTAGPCWTWRSAGATSSRTFTRRSSPATPLPTVRRCRSSSPPWRPAGMLGS